jgi:predicted nucleic acid-binding protein
MTDWLLDTNIISELRRPRPEPRVIEFVKSQPLERLYASVVTFAEIRFGIELLADPTRRVALGEWLSQEVRPMFADRTLAVSEDVMFRWRVLVESGRKDGHTFPQRYLIIAATALQHGLVAVTRDRACFERAGATVYDPWSDPPPA